MKRYTVILSDHSGYADNHVLAKDRKAAEAKAVALHCCTDSERARGADGEQIAPAGGYLHFLRVGCSRENLSLIPVL